MRDERTHDVIDAAVRIHQALGPGLLESVYQRVLAYELRQRGHAVSEEAPVGLSWGELVIPMAFRADLIVDGAVLVEVKATPTLSPVARRQTLTYMRCGGFPIGLLLNFGAERMRDGIHRLVLG